MQNILSLQQNSYGSNMVIWIFVFALFCMVLLFVVKMIDTAYIIRHKKPFFVPFYPFLRKLDKERKAILTQKFRFYNRLTPKQKRYLNIG